MNPLLLHYALRIAIMWSWAATIGDWVSTNRALGYPGNSEANPIMRWAMKLLGTKWVFFRMALAQGLIFYTVHNYDNTWQSLASTTLAAAGVSYVVYHNWKLGG